MARKKEPEKKKFDNPAVVGLHAAVTEQPITRTLETNFMPYAMSVIVSGDRRLQAFAPQAAVHDV